MSSINQLSFAGGEISRAIWGRTDLVKYASGLKTCKNFVVLAHGGVENRSGTRFIAEAKYHDKKCRIIPFEFSSTQTYALEFGHKYIRFYTNGGQIVDANGDPVEIESPYSDDDLPLLKYVQSADLLTLCHPNHHPKNLGRYGHDDWRLTDFDNKKGPFQELNLDEEIKVKVSAVDGAITITANQDLFKPIHVGTNLYIEQQDSKVGAWTANTMLSQAGHSPAGQFIRSNGKTYIAVGGYPTAGNNAWATGGSAPDHDEGEERDGPGLWDQNSETSYGILWKYLHSGFGIVQIDEVIDGKTAKGTVIVRLPDELITFSSYKWAFSAWSEEAGYPKTAMYYQQRLVFASTRKQPQTIWMSCTGKYNNFGISFPGKDDDAITLTISARQINEIRYLVPLNKLIVLTSAGEWVIGDVNQALTPSTAAASVQGYRGCSHNEPLVIGATALFVQEKGSLVRDLAYRFEDDVYSGTDLSVMSNHLFKGHQIVDWTYAQVPNSVCWAVRNDGVLLGLTYMREQDVWGWHRHNTDGLFESATAVSEQNEDKVYLCVKREIGGQIKRYIEVMATRVNEPVEKSFFVDCGLSYEGEPKQTFSGLDHLEGKKVSILFDGNVHKTLVVVNGSITLDYPAKVVHIGLPYLSEIETLDINIPTQETIRDKKKLISNVSLYFDTTRGGWIGEKREKMSEFKPRVAADNYGRIEPFTGLSSNIISADWNKGGTFIVQQRDPLPMSILNAIPVVSLGGT